MLRRLLAVGFPIGEIPFDIAHMEADGDIKFPHPRERPPAKWVLVERRQEDTPHGRRLMIVTGGWEHPVDIDPAGILCCERLPPPPPKPVAPPAEPPSVWTEELLPMLKLMRELHQLSTKHAAHSAVARYLEGSERKMSPSAIYAGLDKHCKDWWP